MFSTKRAAALLLVSQGMLAQACESVLYTLDNSPEAAYVVSMCVSMNGTIMDSYKTPTGGKGLSGTETSDAPAVGSLFGADSVIVSGNYLFAVNPGSNTVSMFFIHPDAPMRPTLVGKPANTMGEFPMSVSYSPTLKTACVLNGGAVSGVSCLSVDPVKGMAPVSGLRTFPMNVLNQTTPPSGPFSTASHVHFNPSTSALLVSIKGNPMTNPQGTFFAYPVANGQVAMDGVMSQPKGVVVPFGMRFLGNDFQFVTTDPHIGADYMGLSADGDISVLKPVNVTGQKAVCWAYYSPEQSTIYVTDTALNAFSAIDYVSGAVKDTITYPGKGAIDTLESRGSLYSVTQSAEIINVNVAGYAYGKSPEVEQVYSPYSGASGSANTTAPLVGLALYHC